MENGTNTNMKTFSSATSVSNTPNAPKHSSLADSQEDFETIMPLMQHNGRKVLGPPEDWTGPAPSNACELYIRHIPKKINDFTLIQPFLRFGQIYEIRVPVEYNNCNRGFAYVKYTKEDDAACAIEVMRHYFVSPGRKFDILYSYEKCRLFVSNVPRNLTEDDVECTLRGIFPTMVRVSFRPGSVRKEMGVDTVNRGHVFVHFATHLDALAAKRKVSPGLIRLWDRDVKVVWADSDRDSNVSPTAKTLFVRHVDLTVNVPDLIDLLVKHVSRTEIRKVSKVRTSAFIDFVTREAAEICLRQLQGITLRGHHLEIEWARPSEQQSLHRMRNIDFDAVMRLKCLANSWSIPVILFGTYFFAEKLQYAAIMLRDRQKNMRAIYCVLECSDLNDIHSRLCEVVCGLIETIGTFPDYNYMFLVEKENSHLLGMVTHNSNAVEFIAAHGAPQNFTFDLNEVVDLSVGIVLLHNMAEETLITMYHESFRTISWANYLPNLVVLGHRVFGTISPKYRNKPPLNYNLNDTQIVLALCYVSTGSNLTLPHRPYVPFAVESFNNGNQMLQYVKLKLLPLALSQSRWENNHSMDHIVYGDNKFYHPVQKTLMPPLWMTGCSYDSSIKQRLQQLPSFLQVASPSPMFTPTSSIEHSEMQHYQLISQNTIASGYHPMFPSGTIGTGSNAT